MRWTTPTAYREPSLRYSGVPLHNGRYPRRFGSRSFEALSLPDLIIVSKCWNDNILIQDQFCGAVMRLDETDVEILALLQKSARSSYRAIARKLDITTPTVSSKVRTMEELGLIRGYRADIDAEVLSESSIVLIVKASPKDLREVAEELRSLGNATEIYVLGNSRIFVKATFIKADRINDLLSGLTAIREITEYEYYPIIETVKEGPRTILGEDLSITLKCYYCKKAMKDAPVKLKLGGKVHYLCCNTCSREYKKKYERLNEEAQWE